MVFICYPNCSTCKKIQKELEDNNIELEIRNIKENIPTIEEITTWLNLSNKEIKSFFNTSGLVYKELKLKDKLPSMSTEEKIKLLSTNGMLIKRPIIINNNQIIIGNNKKEIEVLINEN